MGRLILNKIILNSVSVAGISPPYFFTGGSTSLTHLQNGITYRFFSGSNNTIGTFLSANELTRSTDNDSSDRLSIELGGTFVTYYARSNGTWIRVGNSSDQSSVVIPERARIIFQTWDGASKNVTVQGANVVTIIETLDTFFNKNEFTQGTGTSDSDVVTTVDSLNTTRNYFIRASDSTWRRSGSASNQGSVPINIGQAITFTTFNNIQKIFTMTGNKRLARNQSLGQGQTSIKKTNLGGGKLIAPESSLLLFMEIP